MAAAASSETLTRKGAQTRAELLQAARRVFARHGYANSKIAEIAAEAGKAAGSFYSYFDSKEQLLEEVAEQFKQQIRKRASGLDHKLPPEQLMHRICEVYWKTCEDHRADLAAIFQASMLDEAFAARWREIRYDGRRDLARLIRRAQREGGAVGLHARATASALGSMMDYFCYVWLVEGGDTAPARLDGEVAVQSMAQILFRTLYFGTAS